MEKRILETLCLGIRLEFILKCDVPGNLFVREDFSVRCFDVFEKSSNFVDKKDKKS